ncbi:hypothetical protein LshimejAT787_0705770 [Lyophyllum shimeji]|uniref:Alpha-type protein kinase domain-containing protein n=1 Tax=Lyophyllum shimeji TaxID=47721 RepID=A0A9P3PRI6_LYOSH|nr:hypothetical protein LshimejAT787_0705770 [Lyophyllum shimeji]
MPDVPYVLTVKAPALAARWRLALDSVITGGNSLDLLSDPQISSARELEVIFADGNIPSIHANFEESHRCNHFCRWVSLPTDYALWHSDSDPKDYGKAQDSGEVDENED